MTKLEILLSFEANFLKGFAKTQRDIMIKEHGILTLLELLSDLIIFQTLKQEEKTQPAYKYLYGIKRNDLVRLEFRVAYVFENLYYFENKFFESYYSLMISVFSKVSNESTKRHFSKVMSDILAKDRALNKIKQCDCELIAATCIDWIINQKVRVAVQVWAIECLIYLKKRVTWVPDLLDDLLLKLSFYPSAGMKVRLKKWKTLI